MNITETMALPNVPAICRECRCFVANGVRCERCRIDIVRCRCCRAPRSLHGRWYVCSKSVRGCGPFCDECPRQHNHA